MGYNAVIQSWIWNRYISAVTQQSTLAIRLPSISSHCESCPLSSSFWWVFNLTKDPRKWNGMLAAVVKFCDNTEWRMKKLHCSRTLLHRQQRGYKLWSNWIWRIDFWMTELNRIFLFCSSAEYVAFLAIVSTFFLFLHTKSLTTKLREMETRLQPSAMQSSNEYSGENWCQS